MESSKLYAAAKLVAPDCGEANVAFVKCKMDKPDPSACLGEGAVVRKCVERVVEVASTQCKDAFDAYSKCLVDTDRQYENCRVPERALKVCYYRVTRLASGATAMDEGLATGASSPAQALPAGGH